MANGRVGKIIACLVVRFDPGVQQHRPMVVGYFCDCGDLWRSLRANPWVWGYW